MEEKKHISATYTIENTCFTSSLDLSKTPSFVASSKLTCGNQKWKNILDHSFGQLPGVEDDSDVELKKNK